MANNKVTIYIHNQRYRFLAEENEDYLQQCADIVTIRPNVRIQDDGFRFCFCFLWGLFC